MMGNHRRVWRYDASKKKDIVDEIHYEKHDDIDCIIRLADDDPQKRFCAFSAKGPALIGCRCGCHDYIRYHQKEGYYEEMLFQKYEEYGLA